MLRSARFVLICTVSLAAAASAQGRPPPPAAPSAPTGLEAAPTEEPGYTVVRLPGGGYYRYRTDEKPDSATAHTANDEPGTVQIVPSMPRAAAPATPAPQPAPTQTPADEPGSREAAVGAGLAATGPSARATPCLAERQSLARRLLQLRGVYDVPLSSSMDVLATADLPLSPWVQFSIFGVVPTQWVGSSQLVNAVSFDFETQWRLEALTRCEERSGLRAPVPGLLP